MKYVYPAIFTKEVKGYSIHFPDLESCYTQGDNLEDGIEMAEDVLAFTLYNLEKNKSVIPAPSDIKLFTAEGEDLVTLVKCDTALYRKRNSSKAVKKTLTIPEWLNEEATSKGVNFSQVLQEALIDSINKEGKL
ncbi:type II toxin-antitoxin system HicB family antitoxin [Anaerovorax odorimutans]|uniref:type II toxin-antitoxin system HicB family antitoxin n=1 Tax=Anaerovorax odorimutans TaxID=109327 RepID=UPI0004193BFD|nr:type II toxin-antitoxin system HicB family antitoxin [Anaerovorax odorimutans]